MFFLKHKSKVFKNFKKFKFLVEKESSDMLIKTMKDVIGDQELTLNEFQKYCEDHGIHRLLVVSRSSQQNRVSERKNKTNFDIIRSMLKNKKITQSFGHK